MIGETWVRAQWLSDSSIRCSVVPGQGYAMYDAMNLLEWPIDGVYCRAVRVEARALLSANNTLVSGSYARPILHSVFPSLVQVSYTGTIRDLCSLT